MAENIRDYILTEGLAYWQKNPQLIKNLPIPVQSEPNYRFTRITLPEWAKDLGHPSDNTILVDTGYISDESKPGNWKQVDWISYTFYLLNGTYEKHIEAQKGIIHSYAFKLKEYPQELWEYAWVNRIFLLLRRWAARIAEREEISLFGELPTGKITLTHDVDALHKTLAIRLKQTAFHGFNGFKLLLQGKISKAFGKFSNAVRFFFSTPSYMKSFTTMLDLEEQYNVRSLFTFYGGKNNSLKRWLFDPNYNLQAARYQPLIKRLKTGGWQAGLHQSFEAWEEATLMKSQKESVEKSLEQQITHCRQHWLRFSWKKTWDAQEASGFLYDYTLGFNDRIGFRNGSALAFHPWDDNQQKPRKLTAIPMALMDSHLFDYQDFDDEARIKTLQKLIKEVMFVGGAASIIWHPHTISSDYGWLSGYTQLLDCLRDESVSQ
jgi:hypothetical protein